MMVEADILNFRAQLETEVGSQGSVMAHENTSISSTHLWVAMRPALRPTGALRAHDDGPNAGERDHIPTGEHVRWEMRGEGRSPIARRSM